MKIPKFLNKKTLLIGAPVATLLIAGGVVLVQPASNSDNKADMNESSKQTTEDDLDTDAQPVQPQESQTIAPSENLQPTQTPQAQQDEPAPIFGVDPDDASYMKVFDKNAVMEQAGVEEWQRPYADQYITLWSGWRYKEDGSKALCFPPRRQGQLFYSNPVEHLSYCNRIVNAPNSNWQTKLTQLQADIARGSGYLP